MPADGMVRLTVHDVLGREVAQLVNGREAAGVHEVQWAPGAWRPAGCTLRALVDRRVHRCREDAAGEMTGRAVHAPPLQQMGHGDAWTAPTTDRGTGMHAPPPWIEARGCRHYALHGYCHRRVSTHSSVDQRDRATPMTTTSLSAPGGPGILKRYAASRGPRGSPRMHGSFRVRSAGVLRHQAYTRDALATLLVSPDFRGLIVEEHGMPIAYAKVVYVPAEQKCYLCVPVCPPRT